MGKYFGPIGKKFSGNSSYNRDNNRNNFCDQDKEDYPGVVNPIVKRKEPMFEDDECISTDEVKEKIISLMKSGRISDEVLLNSLTIYYLTLKIDKLSGLIDKLVYDTELNKKFK